MNQNSVRSTGRRQVAPAASKFDQRREAILDAATHVMAQKGVRGTTLTLVANELGLASRGVSYYFQHKEEIAAACYRRSIERMEGLVTAALAHETTEEALRAFVRNFFEIHRQVQVGEARPTIGFEEMRTLKDPETDKAFVGMYRKVRSIFQAGDVPAFDRPERSARAHMLLSQVFWSGLWLPRYHPDDYGYIADRMADVLLGGIAAGKVPAQAPPIVIAQDEASGPDFLGAATQLINDDGYRGASVSKICARLGVTKGSFYHRIDAKDELVEQCFARTWAILREAQVLADQATKTSLANLYVQARAMVHGQVTGEHPLLRTSALAAVPEAIRPALFAGFDRITNRYASVVSNGLVDGSIRPVDVPVAAQMISGAINAAVELRFWVPQITAATAETLYLKPLFEGMLRRPK